MAGTIYFSSCLASGTVSTVLSLSITSSPVSTNPGSAIAPVGKGSAGTWLSLCLPSNGEVSVGWSLKVMTAEILEPASQLPTKMGSERKVRISRHRDYRRTRPILYPLHPLWHVMIRNPAAVCPIFLKGKFGRSGNKPRRTMRLAIIDDLLFVGEKFCSDQTYLGSTITDFSCYGQFLHPSKLLLSELQYIQSTYGKHGDRNICRHRKWPER